MYKKIKKFLAVITVSTGALFAINGASSALASEYLATPQDFPAELTASGTQISGDKLTYKSDVTKYDIKYSAKMNVSSIWSYYNYYVMFDPSDNKAASNATVIKGGFTITFTSADVLAIKDGVDLKSMVENNVSTDKDNGVYGSSSKFYDYFVVESVTKAGNNLVIKMNVKDGVDGTYLANKKSELPQEILIRTLADYTSVNGTDLTNDQKIVSSGTYEGKIILDTPDNYAVALQSTINRVRSNPILGFFAAAYFPTDATAPVTSLAIPVNSSSENTLTVVKKETKHTVTYEFVSGTTGKTLPADLVAPLPTQHEAGTNVDITTTFTFTNKEVVENGQKVGEWKFKEWNPATITAIAKDEKVVGTWEYTETSAPQPVKHTVGYTFEAKVGSPALPAEVTALIPASTQHDEGTDVTFTQTFADVKVTGGTWKFKGWDPVEIKAINAPAIVKGTWEFKLDTNGTTQPVDPGNNNPWPTNPPIRPNDSDTDGDRPSTGDTGKSGKGTKKLASTGQTTTNAVALGLVALGLVAFLARKKQK